MRAFTPALAMLLRVFGVLIALHGAGLVHGVTEVVTAIVGSNSAHETCPVDRPCDNCPAGCPNCHGASARPLVPPSPVVIATVAPIEIYLPESLYDAQVPKGPELSSIFRPPRSV